MTTAGPLIGFIGFGEAGSTIARGLRSAGATGLFAYDIQTDAPVFGPEIRERARSSGTTLVASPAALTAAANVLLSTVTSSSALEAACQTAPHLTESHLYADLNSVSPALKREVERVVTGVRARFVEVAVMAPVAPYGHRVPMLTCGAGAGAFAEAMAPFGMSLQTLGPDAATGSAAAVKMCRSIVVKGLEALMVECVLAATRFGADDLVFASLNESFPGIDWKKLADYMTARVAVHGERRAREMEEVSETLRSVGVEPIMSAAAARRQDWAARLDLRSRFGPDGPASYRELAKVQDGV
jgi:3-hydroxyisobutyrate dehydrogenase-like beta-hydroxyacid dehydrogenase